MAHSSTFGHDQDRTNTDATQASAESDAPVGSAFVSRRSLRTEHTVKGIVSRSATSRSATSAKPVTQARASTGSGTAPRSRAADSRAAEAKRTTTKKKGWAVNVAVMTVATGIIATMSLPAFALSDNAESSTFGPSAADSMKKAQPQSVEVGGVASSAVARDAVSATTEEQLAVQKAATDADAARQRAATTFTNYANSYSGPSVADFLANPPYPDFSLPLVFSVAEQYLNTPYVFGGNTPAGFDCSGYVQYVYAQFGVPLPHSVSGQADAGKPISIKDAQPGDLVIMPGHNGFYAGNGYILDAPAAGSSVSARPIWTSNYYIVRLGI